MPTSMYYIGRTHCQPPPLQGTFHHQRHGQLLLRPLLTDCYHLTTCPLQRFRQPSVDTKPSSARARKLQHPQSTPPYISSDHRTPTAFLPSSPGRSYSHLLARGVSYECLPYAFKTSRRASSGPCSYSLFTTRILANPGPTKINLRPAQSTSSWNANYGTARLQRQTTGPSSRCMTALTHCPPSLGLSSKSVYLVQVFLFQFQVLFLL